VTKALGDLRGGRRRRTKRGAASPPGEKLTYGRGNLPVRVPKLRPDWPHRGGPKRPKDTCIKAVKQYLGSLSSGQRPTSKGYPAFAANEGLPSLNSLKHQGGLKPLLAEAWNT